MNSTFLFTDKIHDSVSRIETWLALPSTANSTNSNASNLDSVSSNPKHKHHINAKLLKVEIPKCNGKPWCGKVLGISFWLPLIVK